MVKYTHVFKVLVNVCIKSFQKEYQSKDVLAVMNDFQGRDPKASPIGFSLGFSQRLPKYKWPLSNYSITNIFPPRVMTCTVKFNLPLYYYKLTNWHYELQSSFWLFG